MAEIGTVDWGLLKGIRCWRPIAEVAPSPEPLGDRLFRLGPQQYVVAVPYNQRFERTEESPFATIAFWAPTDGAAKRAILMQIEDDEQSEADAPVEMLLPGAPTTYGDIERELKTGRHGTYQQTASYRIAKDGAFVDRQIIAGPYTFHFRSREDDPSERPYAIQYRLS